MTADNRIEQLLNAPSDDARRQVWDACLAEFSVHDFSQHLKQGYLRKMRSDPQEALRIAALMHELSIIVDEPTIHALALRTEANIRTIALGQHEQALQLFEQAAQIYTEHNQPVEVARVDSGRVWPLGNLERYQESVTTGHRALSVFKQHEEWLSYSTLANNVAMVHNRYGKPQKSLPLLETASHHLAQGGEAMHEQWVGNAINYIYVLSMLGRFEESLAIGQRAESVGAALRLPVITGLIKQNLALTYSLNGQFNQALKLYDEAIAIWEETGWPQGRVQVEVSAAFCLLQLRRFWEVIQRYELIHQLCQTHGVLPDTPYSLLWEAKALAGLEQYDAALETVNRVGEIIASNAADQFGMAVVDLVRSELWQQQKNFAQCAEAAQRASAVLSPDENPLEFAESLLMQARAFFGMAHHAEARKMVEQAITIATNHQFLSIAYAGEALLGHMARDPLAAFAHFEKALGMLRQIQAGVMLEFRPNFLQDAEKQLLTEAMVKTCLKLGQTQNALSYIEEAKSRSLLTMVAHRVPLRVEARNPADRPIVDAIRELTARRNALYRQLQNERVKREAGRKHLLTEQTQIETELTRLRNTLLVRNADYARDLTPEKVDIEAIQTHLAPDTLLVEFFSLDGQLLAVCVSAETMTVHRFTTSLKQVQRNQYALNVNFKTIPRLPLSRVAAMTRHAQKALRSLYQQLIAPIAARLQPFQRLIIIPHDSLHYLPFHALFDGEQYLAESHVLSYLPASSFLSHVQTNQTTSTKMLTVGCSYNGLLPHALAEAELVATACNSQLLLEEEASRSAVIEAVKACKTIHIATHGEFRADNPLFSGLALHDSWLTTLDIFNMELTASLVTLSGCHTGKGLLGGGDELLGLTRAFLAAGARSLLLSHWAVEDSTTAQLMHVFYEALNNGATKGEALQNAQRYLLTAEDLPPHMRHPYFWAPFYLVGADDLLL